MPPKILSQRPGLLIGTNELVEMAGHSTDDSIETWRRWRVAQGETVTIIELYGLVARRRGLAAEQLPLEERQALAARALEVIYPGFELGQNSERSDFEPISADENGCGHALERRSPRLHGRQKPDHSTAP